MVHSHQDPSRHQETPDEVEDYHLDPPEVNDDQLLHDQEVFVSVLNRLFHFFNR